MNRYWLLFALSFNVSVLGATVRPFWTVREPDAGNPVPVVTDLAGNTYFAKWSYDHDHTLTIVKRGPNGRRAWSTSLQQEAFPLAITVDSKGSVYVTGTIYNYGNPTNFADAVTWRFDRNGRLLWRVVYPGSDNTDDFPIGIGLDDAGRVYVVNGIVYRFNPPPAPVRYLDFISYDANGNLIWSRRLEAGAGGALNTGAVAINPRGGVAAATPSTVLSCSAEGELLWSWQSDGAFFVTFDNVDDFIARFDQNNHLYLAGGTGPQWVEFPSVRKFSPTGTILWTSPYRGSMENPGELVDLRVDAAGNAYLGIDAPISCHYQVYDEDPVLVCHSRPAVIKFSPDGDFLWASRFAASADFQDYFLAGIALSANGRVTLAARAYGVNPSDDSYFTQDAFLGQCDMNGNQIWQGFFHYGSGRDLWPYAPGVSTIGSIYLPAELIDRGGGSDVDFLLAKFHPFQLRQAPQIQRQPVPQTVATGGKAVFTVQASGHSRLRYQWFFNSVPLPGKTGTSLTLEDVRLEQAGDYSVQVRGAGGQIVSPEARLTVTPVGN